MCGKAITGLFVALEIIEGRFLQSTINIIKLPVAKTTMYLKIETRDKADYPFVKIGKEDSYEENYPIITCIIL